MDTSRLNHSPCVIASGIDPAAGARRLTLHHDGLCFALQGPEDLVASVARVASYAPGSPAAPAELPSAGPARPAGQPGAAAIDCRLERAPKPARRLESAAERGWLRWEWTGEQARVWTLSAEARISRRGPGFSVEVRLPAGGRAVQTLLSGISSAILHALGGIIVHSSSVLLDGGVIAFLGPSGAGKSTASRQARGAALFSVDRLAIAPLSLARGSDGPLALRGHSGWMAYPLLGGTLLDPEMPRAAAAWSPLHAVFRVHQAPSDCRVEDVSRTGKLALLRESTYLGGHGPSAELQLLSRLERLGADVPVARLHFSMGTSLTSLLRRSVRQSPPE